jgi:CheY-like chemotaxis protein
MPLAGLRIVVVDDEPDARELVAHVLERSGATVFACASVEEAFALVSHERPDVLVSDIGMPGEDGYSLIRKVRGLPPEAGGRIPAAALTAFGGGDDRRRALLAGFQMHVTKPVEPDELVAVVAALAQRA